MLAVETLSAGWQAVLFGVATLLFLIAAIVPAVTAKRGGAVALVPLGLAFATFVFFYNALAAA
jgi:hypothetical protein